jgi:hypothetical protein
MRCTLSWAVALAMVMAAATANAALTASQVAITTVAGGDGNPTITTPDTWATYLGSNPTYSMVTGAGGANSLQNVPFVNDGSDLMGFTFKAPASPVVLDKIAWVGLGAGTGATFTMRLIDLGTADPNTAYAAAGTDLFNGGAGLSLVHPGAAGSHINVFDLTGSDEVSLTPGNTYAFELVRDTAVAGTITLVRTGAGNSTYADGQYWKLNGAPPPRVIQASSGAPRDAVAAVYLAPVPEPSTFVIAGIGAAIALAMRRRK